MLRSRPHMFRRYLQVATLALFGAALYLSWQRAPAAAATFPVRRPPWAPPLPTSAPPPPTTPDKNKIYPNDPDDTAQKTLPGTRMPGPGLRPYLDAGDRIPKPGPARCGVGLEHLHSPWLMLSDDIIYRRRCIKTVWSETVDRNEVAVVKEPLLVAEPAEIKLSACAAAPPVLQCGGGDGDGDGGDQLVLRVPPPHAIGRHDDLMFGIASSASRLADSALSLAHWLSGTRAKLIGVVTDGAADNIAHLNALYAVHGIKAEFRPVLNQSHTVSQTHFTMIRDMLNASTAATRWFGVFDDDTFTTSLNGLADGLRRWDPAKPWYIGALSEDWNAVRMFGLMGFGGAGAFLSRPLVEELLPHIDSCIDQATIGSGDGILRECVHGRTASRLQIMPGLWQQDIADDASGFFEADPQPLLTVHHWKSWYWDPIQQMAAVTHWCGDCFLQRWRLGRDTVLANGYSISIYRNGHRRLNLGRKEATWRHAASGYFDLTMGPLRRKMGLEEKKQFKLARSGLVGPDAEPAAAAGPRPGPFVQTYVYRGSRVVQGGKDEVIDLVWS